MGKSKSLRDRVRSYFVPPVNLRPITQRLVSRIDSIEHIEVNSDLESLLLESRLIKKFRPRYNIASKDDRSPYYIHFIRDTYPLPVINHNPDGSLAGPFLSGLIVRRVLHQFRRVAPYCTSHRPVKRPCLYSHLGLCNPCPATGDRKGYLQNIARLKSLIRGHFASVRQSLQKDMGKAVKSQDYESAAKLRDQLKSLDYLLLTPVAPDDYIVNPNLVEDQRQEAVDSLKLALSTSHLILNSLHRIEFFDNAHLSGTAPTSAMTVAIDGEVTTRHYRHFTLKNQEGDDIAMMGEVLSRRLKRADWPTPDLIVLDGGLPQLSVVSWNIPTIALAKKQEIIHLPNGEQIKLDKSHPGLKLLMHLRDEAHRFSRRLHHKHRSKMLK
ncbi:hypothetical protein A2634_04240 [Candidatus Amesbacteria bacterium RIFCSPHIGHO2_01_FULL_48_32]|uniref:Excinuclease ABC subunit C n=1 Tax=Candidatus Amesbacteria bacterium RIFCSPLOWO2_01_FULL_48_25 TaxID=1797259 RepID=A0A1F4ZD52_9BACT|nr:MAG: hypothetical protein A2634_04240 [Candidatus Amesbacteria bacterium RIFCSPHIGHO2_01_FULL_48_32]OGD03886.1 MAG: hypothetical protein A2989_04265 [Candidatus Amesbacteria bacterium RIFCSPLOWO2_01_FULL_48_25]HJZ05450.1 UvrB/UvrC motif-containing protein [Patescibacteria group bacterium]